MMLYLPGKTTLDRLYLGLGLFTNLYLAAIAIEFFLNLHRTHPRLELLLDAFAEPYLGALAVYTVLKEIQKRRTGRSAARRGEWYVVAWLLLLAVTTSAVALTEQYRFDLVYRLIITNSLAALMIFIGSRIHKP